MQSILPISAGGGASTAGYDSDTIQEALEAVQIAPDKIAGFFQKLSESSTTGSGSVPLLIFFFCLAIGVSFFCSVWEAVLLSISRPYIANLKQTQPKRGELLEELKTRIDRPLTSILTLNTIAHTMGAMGVASQVSALTGNTWETLVSVVMTLTILIASEIIPKNLGARYWKRWAPWTAICLKWLAWFMTPIVWFIALFSKGGHLPEAFSRDELSVMADMGEEEGKLHADESRILRNLLIFRETTVNVVKTPRVVVFALPVSTTAGEFVQKHSDSPFSRIPIYGENRDHIEGFVIKDDIFLAVAQDDHDVTLESLSREVPLMSELISLTDAFRTLNESRSHIAIVHDEFGGMSGLVTMEDIVETLLGLEIVDEVDTKDDMQVFARKMWKRRVEKMGLEVEVAPAHSIEEPPVADGKKEKA